MKRLILICWIAAAGSLIVPLVAQDSATTTAPVVRSEDGNVVLSVRVKDFVPGKKYRIGLGGVGEKAPEGTYQLMLEDSAYSAEELEFTQKNTSHWWGVEQLAAKGFSLTAEQLPEAGKELTFRVAIPQAVADQFSKLYLFVSRDYGSGTWYLEDGSELADTYW